MGETGELVIGGVGPGPLPRPGQGRREVRAAAGAGLGRAPTAAATWCAPSRPGCCSSAAADEQVKLGGRRIELGEVDAALLGAARRRGAAAAVRRTAAGNQVLVGYVVPATGAGFDRRRRASPAARARCRPRWCRCSPWSTTLPTRTSGKVDRDALPWPLPAADGDPVRPPG